MRRSLSAQGTMPDSCRPYANWPHFCRTGNGVGVPKDKAEAVKWYRKAADQGNADAQYYLGMMYELGSGVAIDLPEALKWYRQAAQLGNRDAESAASRILSKWQ